jgi:hypothetical protein
MMDKRNREKKKERERILKEIDKEEVLKKREEEGTNAFFQHSAKLGELREKAD